MLSTFSFTDSLSFVSIAFSFSIWLIRFFKEVFSFFTFERRSININILDSSLSNFEIVPFSDNANIYIINRCTVTNRSDSRCRQTIRRAIQTNKDAFIVVTGCYSQINPEEIGSIKGVDMILGNMEKLNIVNYLEEFNEFKNGGREIKKLDKPKTGLSDLVEMLTDVKSIERIRLSSINPREVSDRLISLMKKSKKVCRHLHIPLQSGDNEILKSMRRDYSSGFYKDLIMKLKGNIPDIGIGADVIVGFPGENEEKFTNTYRLIEELPLSYLHVFTYSQREGTDAFGYEGQITESTKKERGSLVKKLGEHKSNIFKEGFIGKICNVLIENTRNREPGLLKGYTDNYIPIMLKGGNGLMNKIVSVRTTNTSGDAVIG